jgi:formate hydrogenlyase subunit 3/multisubunit Na+/H+ antiporter MnhD subunit
MALIVLVAAVVFAVASQPPAIAGIVIGLLSIPLALLVQAAFFTVGSAFGRWLGPVDVVARTSRGGIEHSSLAAATSARNAAADSSTDAS